MKQHQTSRTLLKSPPELWAECSDAQSLRRHLGDSVGEIQITNLEPEHTVAWEGERASGTVKLEPSGWGTRVTLTCSTAAGADVEQVPEPELAAPEPGPDSAPDPQPEPVPSPPEAHVEQPRVEQTHGRLFARVMRLLAPQRPEDLPAERPDVEPVAPEPLAPPAPESPPAAGLTEPSAPEPAEESATADILAAALDSLGQAHHRPFSRA